MNVVRKLLSYRPSWQSLAAAAVIYLLLACSSAVRAQDDATAQTDVQKIIAAGRDNSQVMAHLDYLVNRIGPRLTSSDGLTNACSWARDTFEGFGLENCHLDKWTEWPVGFNRGPRFGKMVAPEEVSLEFGTDAWTPGTKGKERGAVMLAPRNEEQLAHVKDQLAGKWVLAGSAPAQAHGAADHPPAKPAAKARGGAAAETPAQPAQAADGKQGENAPATTPSTDTQPAATQPTDAQPASTATVDGDRGGEQPGTRGARRGGRGGRGGAVDPFQQKLQAAYEESGVLGTITRTASDLIVTGGRRPTSLDFFDKIPNVAKINMTSASYDTIAKHVSDGEEVALEFDIRNYFKRGPIPIFNVVADIPGSETPDEYVIIGGHIDSWDAATGTTDNGTGCATTMEAARILKAAGVHPKRTIRFMLWSGEEQGLLGSAAYVRANPDLMPKISAVLVHDAGTQFISGISGLATEMDDLKQVFAPMVNLDPNFPFEVKVTNALRQGGSDHSSFIRAGVPGFFWAQSGDLARYRDTHHTQFDTFDRAVPDYQKHSSIVVALAAYRIANLDHMLAKPEAE